MDTVEPTSPSSNEFAQEPKSRTSNRDGDGSYPVHYTVQHPPRFSRLQLAIRVVAFWALGVVGVSFGTVFAFCYLAFPAFAASRLAVRTGPKGYVERDGPRVLSALHWFAAVSAWAGLIVEHLPGRSPTETIELTVESQPHPSAKSALWRVIKGLPSLFVLAILGFLGVLVWIWAALSILLVQRIGNVAFNYLVGLQRWCIRLLAYQASLVDEYPPFSFSDVPPPFISAAHVSS